MLNCWRNKSKLILHRCYCSENKVLFFGTDEFSLGALKALHRLNKQSKSIEQLHVVSCGKPVYVKKKKYWDIPPVINYANENGLTLVDWDVIRAEKRLPDKYELGFVASFGDLIPSKIINHFQRGIVNIHPSLLPRWRGAAPIIHTILSGDQITGVSFIQLSKHKFDQGKLIYQQEIQVPNSCTAEELKILLSNLSGELIPHVVDNFDVLMEQAQSQDEKMMTKAPKVVKSTGYINFKKDGCNYVSRLQRSLPSKIGIRGSWEGKQVKIGAIINTIPLSKHDCNMENGSCLYVKDKASLRIKFQDGWIEIKSLQVECKSETNTQQFYNGYIIDKRTGIESKSKFSTIPI